MGLLVESSLVNGGDLYPLLDDEYISILKKMASDIRNTFEADYTEERFKENQFKVRVLQYAIAEYDRHEGLYKGILINTVAEFRWAVTHHNLRGRPGIKKI